MFIFSLLLTCTKEVIRGGCSVRQAYPDSLKGWQILTHASRVPPPTHTRDPQILSFSVFYSGNSVAGGRTHLREAFSFPHRFSSMFDEGDRRETHTKLDTANSCGPFAVIKNVTLQIVAIHFHCSQEQPDLHFNCYLNEAAFV